MAKRSVLARAVLAVKAFAGTWKEQSISDLDAQIEGTAGAATLAGVNVSENTALNFLALYACVSIRARTIGSLSLHLYKRKERGAERLTKERLYSLVHDAPNEEMTSSSWREAISGHKDTWGNSYSWIDRPTLGRNAGRISQLYPLKPDRMTVRRSGGRLKYDYKVKQEDGTEKAVTYDRDQILHIPGLGYDGVMGYSPVAVARQAIGLGMSFEEFQARWVGQGTHPSGLVVPKAQMSDQAYQTWKEAIKTQYSGLAKTGSLMALNVDSAYTPFTVPLKDAEFLGLRRFQLEEMARLYGVPLVLLQELTGQTTWGTGVEHILIAWVTLTVMPEVHKWEQQMNMRLLTERERAAGWYFEHDLNSLMRGDYKSRMEGYEIGRRIGMYNPNGLLTKENENPRTDPGGEEYWDSGPQGQGQSSSSEASNEATRAALRPIITDTMARILNRERADIGAQAERFAKKDDMDGFTGWLGGYWDKLTLYVVEAATPVFAAMGRPECALNAAKQHVSALQASLKVAATGGIDEVRALLEARTPEECGLFEEVSQ